MCPQINCKTSLHFTCFTRLFRFFFSRHSFSSRSLFDNLDEYVIHKTRFRFRLFVFSTISTCNNWHSRKEPACMWNLMIQSIGMFSFPLCRFCLVTIAWCLLMIILIKKYIQKNLFLVVNKCGSLQCCLMRVNTLVLSLERPLHFNRTKWRTLPSLCKKSNNEPWHKLNTTWYWHWLRAGVIY